MDYLANDNDAENYTFAIMKFDYNKEKHKCYFSFKTNEEITQLYSTDPNPPTYDLENYIYSIYFNADKVICKRENNVKDILGYTEIKYETNNGSLYAENIFNMKSTPYYLLFVNDYSTQGRENMITSFDKRKIDLKHVLGRIIPKNETFEHTILDTSDDYDKQRDYMGPVNIDKLHIKLLDKWGNLVNLNNCNYSFVLEFTIIR